MTTALLAGMLLAMFAATLPIAFLLTLSGPRPQEPTPVEAPPPLLRTLPAADVHLDGWLGAHINSNREHWLAAVDLAPRLEPFQHRPAKQAWAGEHLGKWLHATASAFANSGDPALKQRLDSAAAAFLATQEPDGYLGAYLKPQRLQLLPDADWDVWTIKYGLLGLLEYDAAVHSPEALAACRRAADLLLATFGEGKRSILTAGTHVGMAATSVLEPIVKLYRATGDARYLAFARYLVAAWDAPGGPRIASSLREHGKVARTANGKAYEMLSNLVGLCELYRVTGERPFLEPVLRAWTDIVANELQPTGSMSVHEHFTGGGRLPAAPHFDLCETCVTVTWMQLNAHLLEITGDAKFGRELERSACNHLLAAERPDGAGWCYYTALRGQKPYDQGITCCSSSGPRGLELLPQRSVLVGADGALVVNLLESAHGKAKLGGVDTAFLVQSELPRAGTVRLTLRPAQPATFAVRLRVSDWGLPAVLRVGTHEETISAPGFCIVAAREWHSGDVVELVATCRTTTLRDSHDPERAALQWGPCVLAMNVQSGEVAGGARFELGAAQGKLAAGKPLRVEIELMHDSLPERVSLVPFTDAGADGTDYRVWLAGPLPAGRSTAPVVGQSRSRNGNVPGSITDGDRDSFVVTFDDQPATEDWFSITLKKVTPLRRIVFAHGHCFRDGGWFVTTHGAPKVQVRTTVDGEWQTIGELNAYPGTTATDPKTLVDGQEFALELARPVDALSVRVVGVPAGGARPVQAFSSCAELEAFQD